jgi:hypothetical protein
MICVVGLLLLFAVFVNRLALKVGKLASCNTNPNSRKMQVRFVDDDDEI